MKTLFVVLFLFTIPKSFAANRSTLWPSCEFEKYQLYHLEEDRLSYQEMVGEDLIVHLDQKREFERELVGQLDLCFKKMSTEQFKTCSLSALKHNKERFDPEEIVYERHYLGSNYIERNWLMDTRAYDNEVKPLKKVFYTQLRDWLDRCYSKENLKVARHGEIRELYHIIRDSQLNRMWDVLFFSLTPEYSLPSANFIKGDFWGGKDGTFQRIQIQYKEIKVVSERRTGDDEYERVEVSSGPGSVAN